MHRVISPSEGWRCDTFPNCGFSCMWQRTCHCGLCASKFTCVFVDVRVIKFGWAVDKRVELRVQGAGRPFLDVILLSFFFFLKQFSCWTDRIMWTGLSRSGLDKAPGYGGKSSLWSVTFPPFSLCGFKFPKGGVAPFRLLLDFSPVCENMIFTALMNIFSSLSPLCFQIVKVWSEDGAGKVVEIPADMTARDVCQLLVYKSHCLDDNAWTLVEHHPILGLGKDLCVYLYILDTRLMSIFMLFFFCRNWHKFYFCASQFMKRLPVRLTTTNLSQNLLHYHILQTEHSFLLSFSKRSGRSLAFFFLHHRLW